MRKIILSVNVSLDGYLAGPNGELDFMMLSDPKMNEEITRALRERVDTILTGRTVYHAFDANFRAEAANPASPPALVDFANWMVDTPKVVISHNRSTLAEQDRVISGDLPGAIKDLKQESGGDLVLFGGVETVRQFIDQGLIDEYWLKVYPRSLGAGQAMFPTRVDLKLVASKAHESGIITLCYLPA
jgi:dihydrofolate reductase